MGSGIEDLLGGVLGRKGGGGSGGGAALVSALAPAVMGMLAGGGLQKLIAGFQQQGLGDKADSWVRKGPNEPVSGQEVTRALGDDEVERIAGEIGKSKEDTADLLAETLPDVVDGVTPEGEVPQAEALDRRIGAPGF